MKILERELGYTFKDKDLLMLALTHRSKSKNHNNERLEFLGDSIVNHIIAADLFKRFPTASEGVLTRLRAQMVRGKTLAVVAKQLHLDEYVLVGAGERKSGGYRRESTLADVLEAIIAAIYTDADLLEAERRVLSWFDVLLNGLDVDQITKDNKTQLQELMQKQNSPLPTYTLIKQTGKDHNPQFVVRCEILAGKVYAEAIGGSQRKAQQSAAQMVLAQLNTPASNVVSLHNNEKDNE